MPPTDSFGNEIHPELPYARGDILGSVADDYREIQVARAHLRERIGTDGRESVFNFSGLERGFPVERGDLDGLDDELVPAVYGEKFVEEAREHLGAGPKDDVFLANRTTAGTTSACLTLAEPGSTVIGVAPNRSHPSVIRAVNLAGGDFVDVDSAERLEGELRRRSNVSLVILSRMDVTYEHFPHDEVAAIVELAGAADVRIYMDDAAGARVIPAIFDGPRSLEAGVDVVSTGLDKYGVYGPRFGLMGGDAELIGRIRTSAWKLGMEARPVTLVAALRTLERYDPATVRALVDTTMAVGDSLRARFGNRVETTEVITFITGENLLREALARGGLAEAPIVPFEATAAVSMLMVRDHGAVTVHFAGVPSGTGDFLIKFVDPDTLDRFGGSETFAAAVDSAVETLGELLARDGAPRVRRLLLETGGDR